MIKKKTRGHVFWKKNDLSKEKLKKETQKLVKSFAM